MRKTRKYKELEKQHIIKEAKSVGNVAQVAKKNNLPPSTIHTWIKKEQTPKEEIHKNQDIKQIKTKLAEAELENKILKELLKKTYQVWDTD